MKVTSSDTNGPLAKQSTFLFWWKDLFFLLCRHIALISWSINQQKKIYKDLYKRLLLWVKIDPIIVHEIWTNDLNG